MYMYSYLACAGHVLWPPALGFKLGSLLPALEDGRCTPSTHVDHLRMSHTYTHRHISYTHLHEDPDDLRQTGKRARCTITESKRR